VEKIASMVAHFPFDEGTGTSFSDSLGNLTAGSFGIQKFL